MVPRKVTADNKAAFCLDLGKDFVMRDLMTLLDMMNQEGINKCIDDMQETYRKTLRIRTREEGDNVIN